MDLFASDSTAAVPHVSLGRLADAIVVVPATARLIGSYAAGISSDLLTSTLLATRAPVLLCPSMHTEMWEHAAVQHNIQTLRQRGVHVLDPDEGRLAGGDIGKGRLPAPERIAAAVASMFNSSIPGPVGLPASGEVAPGQVASGQVASGQIPTSRGLMSQTLAGVKAVVSAGGTREPIDPVRYIGNRSSGKQGYAIAAELVGRGAQVTLVTSSDRDAPEGAHVVQVETAAEMAEAVLDAASGADVVVMAAAVADYRPAVVADQKLRKSQAPLVVELVPTLDVLAELGARRSPGQVLVGFAAETTGGQELVERGRAKLVAKGADLIVANDVSADGAGFASDYSWAAIVSARAATELGLVDKGVVAAMLANAIAELLATGPGQSQDSDDQEGAKG